MLNMWLISFSCGHARQLHWSLEPGTVYWCLQCTDMQQILDSASTVIDDRTGVAEPDLIEDDGTVWIREPTAAERRELARVQRLITKR